MLGPVNAGKSTLFNALVGEERALVDAEPGTTRDALEARIELGGLSVSLFDTAGLRSEAGRVEALGIARTRGVLGSADLVVLVSPPDSSEAERSSWRAEAGKVPVVEVWSKADLVTAKAPASGAVVVCAPQEIGLKALRAALLARLRSEDSPGAVWLTSQRHVAALRRAVECVRRALAAMRVSTLEVVAGEVGLAVESLGEVTGENASEELLDEVFRRFCIGK